jgi:predicted RNase H-like HicB family nuclease
MKTYVFPVAIDQEEDGRWSATCPSLRGCATWGATKEIALRNIQEAVQAYVADVLEAGEPLPASATVLNEPAVTVTV